MTYKFPGTPAETKVAEFLVASTGGHFVTIVRPGVGELLGVSFRGATIVIPDLIAALSTDAEPMGMDDEDRTPTPAGFDDALWRKADEVHHAMALVARDQECVKIIYAGLSTHNAEQVKTAPDVTVKALTLDALTRYFHSLDAGDISFSDMPAAIYTYLLMDGYIPEESARQEVRSALSAQVQDVAVDGADIGRCIRSLSVEHPLKWAEAEKIPILRGWFVGQVMKHFGGKPDEKQVLELINLVFAMYPASSKHGDAPSWKDPDIFHDAEGRN